MRRRLANLPGLPAWRPHPRYCTADSSLSRAATLSMPRGHLHIREGVCLFYSR